MYEHEPDGKVDTCGDAGGLSFSELEKVHPGPGRPVDEADAGKLIGEVRQ